MIRGTRRRQPGQGSDSTSAALDDVARAVPQHDAAAAVDARCRRARRSRPRRATRPSVGIHDLEDREVGIGVEARCARRGALGPAHPRLGEPEHARDPDVLRADELHRVDDLALEARRDVLAAERDRADAREVAALGHRAPQQVIEEAGHPDDARRLELLDRADQAVGRHHPPAARVERQRAGAHPAVRDLPEREVRRVGEEAHGAVLARDELEDVGDAPAGLDQDVLIVERDEERHRRRCCGPS